MKWIIWDRRITTKLLRSMPNDVWLFGDNMCHFGRGGMAAEMRGEPNSIGVPTKNYPGGLETDYFSDDDYDKAVRAIDAALDKAILLANMNGGDIYVPVGIGQGLANLPEKAPKIWKYLKGRLGL